MRSNKKLPANGAEKSRYMLKPLNDKINQQNTPKYMHVQARNTALPSSKLGLLGARGRKNKKPGNNRYKKMPQKHRNSVRIKINQSSEQKIQNLLFHFRLDALLSKLASEDSSYDPTTENINRVVRIKIGTDVHSISNPPHTGKQDDNCIIRRNTYCGEAAEKVNVDMRIKTDVDMLRIANLPRIFKPNDCIIRCNEQGMSCCGPTAEKSITSLALR